MKAIRAGFEVLTPLSEIMHSLGILEQIGRTCYKSEDRITPDSAKAFVEMLANKGHWAMLEHRSISVRFICDRGVSHEVVRHRIASYAQESTRYCDYSKDRFGNHVTVIDMDNVMMAEVGNYHDGELITMETVCRWINIWVEAMSFAERSYQQMRKYHCPAQLARSVLPTSLKTELVVTMNLREWHHFFDLRTEGVAHPQMREITIPLLRQFQAWFPMLYKDILTPEVEDETGDH